MNSILQPEFHSDEASRAARHVTANAADHGLVGVVCGAAPVSNDWLPIRADLPDDPRVVLIAQATGLPTDTVVGKLVRVWAYFGAHSTDGVLRIGAQFVDENVAKCAGFCAALALENVGWMQLEGSLVRCLRWGEWNASCAKARIKAAQRQSRSRHRNVTEMSRSHRDKSVTTQEQEQQQRREEASKQATSLPEGGTSTSASPAAVEISARLQRLGIAPAVADSLAGSHVYAAIDRVVMRGRRAEKAGKLQVDLAAYIVGALNKQNGKHA